MTRLISFAEAQDSGSLTATAYRHDPPVLPPWIFAVLGRAEHIASAHAEGGELTRYSRADLALLAREIKADVEAVEGFFEPLVREARKGWQHECDRRRSILVVLQGALDILKQDITQVDGELTKGVVTSRHYRFEVVDETQIPREYLTPDLRAIQKIVDKQGALAAESIPGIRVTEYTQVRVRAAESD